MRDRFESQSCLESFRNESDSLRDNSKNLLKALKQHQDVINNSLNKLKKADTNNYSSKDVKYSTDILNKLNSSIKDFNEKCKIYDKNDTYKPPSYYSNFLKTFPMTSMSSLNFNSNYETNNSFTKFKSTESLRDSSQNFKSKTVSFSDYLRTFSTSSTSLNESPRKRMSRSASPFVQKLPKKSILKKQYVEDEMSDCDNNNQDEIPIHRKSWLVDSNLLSSSSESLSTNSLLSMNINNKLNFNDDFDDDYTKKYTSFDSNDGYYLDYVSKKRQSYLNQDDNDDNDDDDNDTKINLNKLKNQKLSNNKFSTLNKKIVNNISKKESNVKGFKALNAKKSAVSSDENIQSSKQSKGQVLNKDQKLKKNSTISSTRQQIINDKNNSVKLEKYKKIAKSVKKNKPLLGSGWAMDALETKLNTTHTKFEKPEEYWRDLSTFRDENREECVSNKPINFDGTLANIYDIDSFNLTTNQSSINENKFENGFEDDGLNHRCIHSYKLNDRLFPVPIFKDDLGRSLCPVCKTPKKEGNSYTPQFCKISIPKSKLAQFDKKYDYNKRKNIMKSERDTFSLYDHCAAGYEIKASKSSNIFDLQPSKTIDLRSEAGLKNKIIELTRNDLKKIATNRDPATSTMYNKANEMRYDLEDNHLKELRRLKESITKMA